VNITIHYKVTWCCPGRHPARPIEDVEREKISLQEGLRKTQEWNDLHALLPDNHVSTALMPWPQQSHTQGRSVAATNYDRIIRSHVQQHVISERYGSLSYDHHCEKRPDKCRPKTAQDNHNEHFV